jgi:twitching motility two-component system response regulator PilH
VPTESQGTTQMTILLVEDSRFLRLSAERALTKVGHRVISAADGNDAVRVAHESLPDLILLDMMLSKMTGPEVLETLRKDPATKHIPVIVLSGLSQKNESKLLKSGATAYFEKSAKMWDQGLGSLIALIEKVMAESNRVKDA